MSSLATPASPFRQTAADGFSLGGFLWRQARPDTQRALVIINAATSVRCRYYSRFADYLFAQGCDVLTYDYRGIGESRPATLRGFQASWSDWGRLDFEAMLQYAAQAFPGQPVDVVGHSFGGCAVGLAPSAGRIRRLLMVGAQFAYWRDYAADQRWRLFGKWHVLMPLLTRCLGYFPGRRLGWLEDTPAGVAMDWSHRTPRYEQRPSGRAMRSLYFGEVQAAILAVSITDDPFGTVAATERLLGYFGNAQRVHLRLAPEDASVAQIGHFAFFHDRFRECLWQIALDWLLEGHLSPETPGQRLPPYAG